MATVVRVKRRRNEDPLEILHLSTKRQKSNPIGLEKKDAANIFKFAGTVASKDESVSKRVREAIKKEKLEKEYKQHYASIGGNIRVQSRHQQHEKSGWNRYRVAAKHRALDLDKLDELGSDATETTATATADGSDSSEKNAESVSDSCGKQVQSSAAALSKKKNRTSNEENDSVDSDSKCKCNTNSDKAQAIDVQKTVQMVQNAVKKAEESRKLDSGQNSDACGGSKDKTDISGQLHTDHWLAGGRRDDKKNVHFPYALVDMEADQEPTFESCVKNSSVDQIVCNSVPMEREIMSERNHDSDYVYDLYFTNNRDFDFDQFETFLTFEALREPLMDERVAVSDDELVYEDDDDDENAERNWRNDYPDEDPGFIENEGQEYYYGTDMNDHTAFEQSNQLADWISSQCTLEDNVELSSDDDVEAYETQGASYGAYYRRVRKEIAEDSDSDT